MSAQSINTDALRELLRSQQNMVEHYSGSIQKRAQNAALEAAGLKPIFPESSLQWDDTNRAKHQLWADQITAIIAHFEGEEQAAA